MICWLFTSPPDQLAVRLHVHCSPFLASHSTSPSDRSFWFVSPTVWNSLPVQSSASQATFKSRLKTHLFHIAFNDQPELWCCVTSSASQDLWNWHLARYKLGYYYYFIYLLLLIFYYIIVGPYIPTFSTVSTTVTKLVLYTTFDNKAATLNDISKVIPKCIRIKHRKRFATLIMLSRLLILEWPLILIRLQEQYLNTFRYFAFNNERKSHRPTCVIFVISYRTEYVNQIYLSSVMHELVAIGRKFLIVSLATSFFSVF